jgi:O-antigen/teichoic acid export membrane protein
MIQRALHKFNSSNSIRSGFWVLVGVGSSQFIRLLSNLVLTRLLLPEYFGMMAILFSMLGLFQMVLDVGLVPSIVNTRRHNDPLFMRTAWTIQVLRSGIIGVITIISAYPISLIYGEPQLFPLVVVAGVVVCITGFTSTALILTQRSLNQKPLIIMQLSTQVVGTLIMIAAAWYFRSVWALMLGYIAGELLVVVASYLFFRPHHSRFCWDKEAAHEIVRFGRWVFVASIFGYIAMRSDVPIMGLWMTMDDLGKYSIAAIFAGMIELLSGNLSGKVLHPQYKKMVDEAADFEKIYILRKQLNIGFTAFCCAIAIGGDLIIRLLYDERYWAAGWMLQILALGKVGHILTSTLQPFLLAKGDSFGVMLRQIAYSLVLVGGLFLGALWHGVEGIIIVYAMIPILCHSITIAVARRHGFHCVRWDTLICAMAIAIVLVAWMLIDAPALDVLIATILHKPID